MTYYRKLTVLGVMFTVATLATHFATEAGADPLPGQVLKFEQKPMIATPIPETDPATGQTITRIYNGHDEVSTAYLDSSTAGLPPIYRGISMADDFADNFDSPVVHVTWWGSYLNNIINTDQPVKKFLIAFEEDVPAGQPGPDGTTLPYSRPGKVLSTQIVERVAALAPGSGTYTEEQITANLPENIYKYNAELFLDKQFPQQKDEIYWLKIVALIDASPTGTTLDTKWGWHSRDYTIQNTLASPNVFPGEVNEQPTVDPLYPTDVWHFQDDAVESDVLITIDSTMPNMPNVKQFNPFPTHYVDGLDGPGPILPLGSGHNGIGRFSKDLAFELYTIPEPATCMLMLISLGAVVASRKRSTGMC